VPRACVAEVVTWQPVEMPGAPQWYLGTFSGAASVPVMSFEGVCGQAIPPIPGRTRIVILVALSG
jgi:chemotaxis signal transduction protein